MKKILLSMLSILLLSGCTASNTNEITLQDIKDRGTLVLGTSPDYPPFEFYDPKSGDIIGFDVAIAQAIADDLGVKLEIKPMSFDMLVESVKNNQVDLVLAGMSPNDKRKEVIAFSDIYFDNEMVFLVKNSNKALVDTKEALAKATIGSQMGSIHTIDEADAAGDIKNVKKLGTMNELVQNLLADSVDAVIIGKQVANQYINLHPDLAVVAIPIDLQIEGMAVALAQNTPELTEHINKLIKQFEADGSFEKWMNEAYLSIEE